MHTSCTPSYLAIGLHLGVGISLSDLHSTTSEYLCISPAPYSLLLMFLRRRPLLMFCSLSSLTMTLSFPMTLSFIP